jgi:hypothetical protein
VRAGLLVQQRHIADLREHTFLRWDQVPVRAANRVSKQRIHPILKGFIDGRFERMGMHVDFVPRKLHDIVQKGLEQPVPPNRAQRGPCARGGQQRAAIGRERNQFAIGQAFQHDAGADGGPRSAWRSRLCCGIAPQRQSIDYVQIVEGGVIQFFGHRSCHLRSPSLSPIKLKVDRH